MTYLNSYATRPTEHAVLARVALSPGLYRSDRIPADPEGLVELWCHEPVGADGLVRG
jgi:hypothetical protein